MCVSTPPAVRMSPSPAITSVVTPTIIPGGRQAGKPLPLLVPQVGEDVFEELERRHPLLHRSVCDESGTVRRHVNLFVNTCHMRDRNGLDTPLAPGDVVTILPAVSGG